MDDDKNINISLCDNFTVPQAYCSSGVCGRASNSCSNGIDNGRCSKSKCGISGTFIKS